MAPDIERKLDELLERIPTKRELLAALVYGHTATTIESLESSPIVYHQLKGRAARAQEAIAIADAIVKAAGQPSDPS